VNLADLYSVYTKLKKHVNKTNIIKKKVFLPKAKKVDFLVQMQGDKKYYSIHKDTFYFLKFIETDEDEDWELHRQEIK
jgi:hypothetical protein